MATLSRLNPFNYIADTGPERFAVGRVNILLAKIFSIGGLAVGLQMLLNAWAQRDILSPWFFWSGFLTVGIGQLGLIYGAFVSGNNRFWQRWYARSIEGVIMLWFLGVPAGTALPEGFYPWAWWGVGLAAVAAFSGLPPARAIVFFTVLDTYWFIARFFPAYGAVDLWLNIQDTLLTFLFASLLGALIFVSRYEASKVDEASARKIAAASEQARAEAMIREKSRLDALVHDKVLTTLLLASKAETAGERHAVTGLAIAAITKLNEAQSNATGAPVSGQSFFDALEKISVAQDPGLVCSKSNIDSLEIPEDVATAFTEATLQAILNSQQHAGPSASRELHLKINRSGLKVVIKDNGRGFRMSRVPKNRLGVRVSIIERIQMVGGRAFIDSRPGAGAAIILEWGPHA
jgi:two-component sensor histidine kinase